jgi:NAD(P) transhydrogenase subunit alpha
MKIGIPKEILEDETRVAVIPSMISLLTKDGHEVYVEAGAGLDSYFTDDEYRKEGAKIVIDPAELYHTSDIILKVQPLEMHPKNGLCEAELIRKGAGVIGFMSPKANLDVIKILIQRSITSFAMEFVPRITRAQSMDALSSMALISGYKAVLIAADHLGKFFPLLMTAAGTIPPATVLVLGAGVAGLQAIATARRLGAKVEAFDPRPIVREQVESLGAKFIEMEITEDVETADGYAREQSEGFLKREQETIALRLPSVDIIITTAQVFGKRAPLLITKDMLKLMQSGSVIVDLATEQGGNCELAEADRIVKIDGVTIIGTVNIPASLPIHASQMYSKNITNLFRHIYHADEEKQDFDDEIVKGTCITHKGEVVNELVKEYFKYR